MASSRPIIRHFLGVLCLLASFYVLLVTAEYDDDVLFVDENYNDLNVIEKQKEIVDIETSYYSYVPPYVPPPAPTTNSNQINFLSQLYDATDGANWLWRTSTTDVEWSFVGTPNPCGNAWQGITCLNCADGDVCSISVIDLSGYNLKGRIDNMTNYQYMTGLVNLTLSDNGIFGSIPGAFNNMVALQSIDLSYNQLTGIIDLNFTAFRSLTILDVSDNLFTGPIPVTNDVMISLSVGDNLFSSSIPDNFYTMSSLQTIVAFANKITGTVPSSIGNMPALISMNFGNNSLVGTIPTTFSSLTLLQKCQFGYNMLNGPFPDVLLSCPALIILDMDANSFTGNIPATISQLPGLNTLNFNVNKFTGTIPDVFGDFAAMYQVGFADNRLAGPLPSSLFELPTMKYVSLTYNKLTGSISSNIYMMSQLLSLGIADNRLTGEIPSTICEISNLQELSLQVNFFDGEIPECLGDLVYMQHFSLNTNHFIGQIPSNFGKLTSLISLSVSNNDLTGPLPSELGGLSNLLGFFVQDNLLTGTLSSGIGNSLNLTALAANNNFLTGEIPGSVANLKNLTLLQLNTNSFQGTVPELISELIALETLLLYSNQFSGGLSEVFSVQQTALSTIDISENNFNGPIPSAIFSLPSLSVISAVKNCFTGSLPEEMCNAVNLLNIDFDGIASGNACIEQRLGFLSGISGSSVYTSTYITGSIPQCLFSLPNLQSLHLSGNGIQSALPDIPSNSKITNISLPFNRIYGTIPLSIQQWSAMKYIDLSSNYLSGTISEMNNYDTLDNSSTVIKLETNRLSGYLPSYFRDAMNINVLSGNVFQCDLAKSSLPKNDPNFEEYSCGSIILDTTINFAFIVIGSFLIIGCAVIIKQYNASRSDLDVLECETSNTVVDTKNRVTGDVHLATAKRMSRSRSFVRSVSDRVSHHRDEFTNYLKLRMPKALYYLSFEKMIDKSDSVPQTSSLFYVLKSVRNLSVFIALVAVFIFVPMSILFKTAFNKKYSTHAYDYGWVISLAYLQGIPPAVVIMVVWGGILVTIHGIITEIDEERVLTKLLFMHATTISNNTNTSTSGNGNGVNLGNAIRDTMAMNRDTMNEINMLRPSVKHPNANNTSSHNNIIEDESSKTDFSLSAMGAAFDEKMHSYFGCSFAFKSMYAYLINCIIVVTANGLYVYVSLTQNTVLAVASLVMLVAFKLYWNMKVVPLLLHSKEKKKNVTSKGNALAHCVLLIFNNVVAPCLATAAADSSCFSLFFIAPSPIDTDFTYPICRAYDHSSCLSEGSETVYTEFDPPFIYSYQCTSSILTKYVPLFMIMFCFTGMVLPCLHTYARISLANRDYWLVDELNTMYLMVCRLERRTLLIISGTHWPINEVLDDSQRLDMMNYKIRSITCNIIGSMAVCLTFGLAYPPLSLVVVIYVFTASSILRSIVQEHLNECKDIHYEFLCQQLEKESFGIASLLQRSSFTLLSHSAAFCFFLLIDISNGFVFASVLLIVTLCICVAYTWGGRNAHSTSLGVEADTSYFYNTTTDTTIDSNTTTNNNGISIQNPMTKHTMNHLKPNTTTSTNNTIIKNSTGASIMDYNRNQYHNNINDDDERIGSVDTVDTHIKHTKKEYRNYDYELDDGEVDLDDRGSSFRLSTMSKISK